MKNKLTKTRFNSFIGISCYLFGRLASLGAVILICSSAAAQDLYVSAHDAEGGKILKFTWDGVRSTYSMGLHTPQGLAIDSAGNVFVADLGGQLISSSIYKVTPEGVRSVFAQGLVYPTSLAFDRAGNLFVADHDSGCIYKYKTDGARSTFVSGLRGPQGLAFDGAGNLFVGETAYNGHIYRYKPDRTRTVFASGFSGQIHLACDSAGNLFVSGTFGDVMSGNVYKITPNGVRTVFASGMLTPASLAFNYQSNLFVVDLGLPDESPCAIYEFTPAAKRSTFVKAGGSGDASLEFNYLAFQPIHEIPNPRRR
jgi:sugar lactone lactonase YvrE